MSAPSTTGLSLLIIFWGLLTASNLQAQIGLSDEQTLQAFTGGVVSASNPLAAATGQQILLDGGNAVDAAVAMQFVLNVVEPSSSGIGGGGFMMIYRQDQNEVLIIDSREKAPAAASADMFLDKSSGEPIGGFPEISTSGISVGVPGTLLGASRAVADYGSGQFTLAQLMSEAIHLASDGFPVNERLASQIMNKRSTFWPETAALFHPGGKPLAVGQILLQPDLAKTLRLIADQGPAAFYEGDIAQAIISAQQRFRETVGPAGAGRMTEADLADYFQTGVSLRQPITGTYRGYTLATMPYPSSGGLTLLQILKLLEPFPLGDNTKGYGQNSLKTLHVMMEAMRLAYADRALWMGDADSLTLPTTGLLDAHYLQPRRLLINPDSRMDDPVAGDPRQFDPAFNGAEEGGLQTAGIPVHEGFDTTHFSVVDKAGNAVSWTSTIESTWGTGIMVPGYGFLLNNELTDFNFKPAHNADPAAFNPGANDVAPGKRPRSSMSPLMVFHDNKLVAAYGSPGGSTIITTVMNITLNLIDHGLDVQTAIDAPRLATTNADGRTLYEAGFADEVLAGLRKMGHPLPDTPATEIGSVQAIIIDPSNGWHYGGADARRAGTVLGIGTVK